MEKSSSSAVVAKLASLLLLLLVVSYPECAAMSCSEVKDSLLPCIPYVLIGGSVAKGCCEGLKTVVKQATTTPERQNVCNCLKSAASSVTDEQFDRAAGIPKQCGVDLKFKLTRDIDCSKIQL